MIGKLVFLKVFIIVIVQSIFICNLPLLSWYETLAICDSKQEIHYIFQ